MQEIWKDIKGYVGLYQVSNLGRFKSLPRNTKNQYKYKERILKLSEDKDGYLLVNLNRKTFRSHVIVAQTFIKNDDNKPQINHIDGNKKNNNVDNLEWVTNRENIIHAYKNGLIKPMTHPKSIYSIDMEEVRVAKEKNGKLYRIYRKRTYISYRWNYSTFCDAIIKKIVPV